MEKNVARRMDVRMVLNIVIFLNKKKENGGKKK